MTTTMRDFVRAHALVMAAERADANPNMDTDNQMDHWKCRIICRHGDQRRVMTTYFSMGWGLGGRPPKLCEVLDCMASDSAGLENNGTLEDWCSEYGYDTDSRKAERTYKTIQRQSARLRTFLGNAAYEALLWDTERDESAPKLIMCNWCGKRHIQPAQTLAEALRGCKAEG